MREQQRGGEQQVAGHDLQQQVCCCDCVHLSLAIPSSRTKTPPKNNKHNTHTQQHPPHHPPPQTKTPPKNNTTTPTTPPTPTPPHHPPPHKNTPQKTTNTTPTPNNTHPTTHPPTKTPPKNNKHNTHTQQHPPHHPPPHKNTPKKQQTQHPHPTTPTPPPTPPEQITLYLLCRDGTLCRPREVGETAANQVRGSAICMLFVMLIVYTRTTGSTPALHSGSTSLRSGYSVIGHVRIISYRLGICFRKYSYTTSRVHTLETIPMLREVLLHYVTSTYAKRPYLCSGRYCCTTSRVRTLETIPMLREVLLHYVTSTYARDHTYAQGGTAALRHEIKRVLSPGFVGFVRHRTSETFHKRPHTLTVDWDRVESGNYSSSDAIQFYFREFLADSVT
ncbi:hypothetical protein J6590_051329 [Homalodisca vitripennis]|nr:hypothetical protein J6590_051329 [Homalodisca vitripennis]